MDHWRSKTIEFDFFWLCNSELGEALRCTESKRLMLSIAAEWKAAAQMEANTEVFRDLKLFKAAFVKHFAIQQSSVQSIKLMMELKQKSDEKVSDFYDWFQCHNVLWT